MLSETIVGAEKSQSGRGFGYSQNRMNLMDNEHEQRVLPTGWDIRSDKNKTNEFIKIALAGSVYSASKMMKASLIICVTQQGDTVTYLNPYDFDCPI